MEVLTLTTLFSVLFAVLFFALFLRMRQKGDSCADQDSLIPFQGPDVPEPVTETRSPQARPEGSDLPSS